MLSASRQRELSSKHSEHNTDSARPDRKTGLSETAQRGLARMGADNSSPDLIVHGVLDHKRSMADIREDLKSIMERLVRDVTYSAAFRA